MERYDRVSVDEDRTLIQWFLRGFIRVHILFHAAERDIYGSWLMEELARHGYRVSPGTLYPLLHQMENLGWLVSEKHVVGGRMRRCYRITPEGARILDTIRVQLRELVREVLPGEHLPQTQEVHHETSRNHPRRSDRAPARRMHKKGNH